MDVADMWAEYKRTSSHELRNDLILEYMTLVKYVASRVAVSLPNSVEVDDLVSYGVFGLIDAIERFDLGRGYKFETFAVARIRGSIMDELRSMDWVPRSMRAKARAIETVRGASVRTLTDSEVADELGYTSAQFNALSGNLQMTAILHLDSPVGGGSGANRQGGAADDEILTLAETVRAHGDAPAVAVEGDDVRHAIVQSIVELPERERVVLALYYYDGLTLAEIGHVLGVTESRVCQLHSVSLRKMKVAVKAAA